MKKTQIQRRLLSWLLAVSLVLGYVPIPGHVHAAEPDGNSCTHETITNGKCDVCGADLVYKGEIGGTVTYYSTLSEACEAMASATAEDKAVVTLMADVHVNKVYRIRSGVFTIDLNGHSITSFDDALEVGGPVDLTIISSAAGGKIEAYYSSVVVFEGTATVKDIKLVSTSDDDLGISFAATYANGGSTENKPRLTLVNVVVESTYDGVSSNYGATVEVIGGSISAQEETVSTYSSGILELYNGVQFPLGISTRSGNYRGTLSDFLGTDMAYWQDGNMLAIANDQTEITGAVTVKKACTHENGTLSYEKNGQNHVGTYSCCGFTFPEEHTGGTATCTTQAVCDLCGASYGELDPDNHPDNTNEDQWTMLDDQSHVRLCSVCTQPVETAQHSTGAEGDKVATCIAKASCSVCGEYGELDPDNHVELSNGFCVHCPGYEAAVLVDGIYEISNAGQLYWFAQKVNNGETTLNAKMMKNIVINENLMQNLIIAEDDTATVKDGVTLREWTPMGSADAPYTGTIDGNGKTISGLYFSVARSSDVGLIGYGGDKMTIQYLGIVESYICAGGYVGAFVGDTSSTDQATMRGCFNTGYVVGSSGRTGGLAGGFAGNVIDCYNTGNIHSGGSCVGGVVGELEAGEIVNCHNTGRVCGDTMAVGGIVGQSKGNVLNCYNTGDVSGDRYVGGIGVLAANKELMMENCYNTGSISGNNFIGGITGALQGDTINCYNVGHVTGTENIGGIAGGIFRKTMTNCFNVGKITGTTSVGGLVGKISTAPEGNAIENSYYDYEIFSGTSIGLNAADGTIDNLSGGKTAEQFKSGEVAYLLQGEQEDAIWGQTIDSDAYPVLGGRKVLMDENGGYYNEYPPLIILVQPQDVQQEIGQKFSIPVVAEGDGLTYQWYVKEAGAKEFKVSVNKTSAYAYTMQSYMHNRQVYCVVTDQYGQSVTSDTATITRPPMELAITKDVEDVCVAVGEKFSVKPTVQGDGLTYQWYVKEAGAKEFKVSSNKTSAYAYTMQSYMHNRQVYCVITDQYGNTVTTQVATITRPPLELKILEQPQDASASLGEKFAITVTAQGDGLTYQWYYKNASGKSFAESSNKSASYSYSMQNYMDGRQVYCVVTDQYGNQIQTETATIRLK